MYPHRIRLRGPWEAVAADGQALGRVVLPLSEPPSDGRAYHRRFGWPNPLADTERLFLVVESVGAGTRVELNGRPLGVIAGRGGEIEIGPDIAARNSLLLRPTSANWPEFRGEVALEVRAAAYLEAIAVARGADSTWHVTGRVVGPPVDHLELYLLLGGRTVAHAPVRALPDGRAFHLEGAAPQTPVPGHPPLRLDLVHVSAVWHRFESAGSVRPAQTDPADQPS